MRHLTITEVARRLVRQVACTQCYQRPPGSAALGPEVARACEGSCPLFFHLPVLIRLAGQVGDAPGDCEAVVKDSICGGCRLAPNGGDVCADYSARTCPLSRYSGQVLAALPHALDCVLRDPGAAAAASREP